MFLQSYKHDVTDDSYKIILHWAGWKQVLKIIR